MKPVDHNRIEAILFDLDGTLLRVQMSEFIPRYIAGLAEIFSSEIKPRTFERVMLAAIRNLLRSEGDGEQTNEQRIIDFLQHQLALSAAVLRAGFARFAAEQLSCLQGLVRPIPLAREILRQCQHRGVKLVLATNPVFPAFMIEARLQWGRLADVPFVHLTSSENSRFCKPQSGYYREIVDRLELPPQQCLMVGNDTGQDLAAKSVGIETFLVDTWLVEREGSPWSWDHRGDHDQLQRFLLKRLG